MKIKTLSLCFLLLTLLSCTTSRQSPSREYSNYLKMVESKKVSLTKSEYQQFLLIEISRKQSHLKALKDSYDQVGERHIQHQSSNTGSTDIQKMHVRSGEMNLFNLDKKMKYIEKELFFLNSQASSLH